MITFAGFWLILIGLGTAVLNSIIDWVILKTKYIYNHSSRVFIRGLIFGTVSAIQHYNIPKPEFYLLVVLGVMVQASVFWIAFDLLLNIMRGLKAFYIGTVAGTDTAFENIPVMQILAKVFLLAVGCLSYFSMVSFF